ncbi:MAG: archaellin/type IV pilin N-terminal domain-containing protein [Candidatus Aenigmatarchaeota archaeon]
MKKGISPLIAAVILIAFVVAVASIVATFFTDVAGEWGEDIEGAAPVECAMMTTEITDFSAEHNGTDGNNNASLSFRSMGSAMNGVVINIYSDEVYANSTEWDEEEEEGDGPFSDGPIEEGRTVTVDLVEQGILSSEEVTTLSQDEEVEIVSLDCTGVSTRYTIDEDDITNITQS